MRSRYWKFLLFVVVLGILLIARHVTQKVSDSRQHVEMLRATSGMSNLRCLLRAPANQGQRRKLIESIKNRNVPEIRNIADELGIIDLSNRGFVDSWKDAWGSDLLIISSNDCSLILLCSLGPNREFDDCIGDDIVMIIDKRSDPKEGPRYQR